MTDALHIGRKWHRRGMAPKLSVAQLSRIYRDQDIWIIGSAASMTHVAPGFFDNKITIGINTAYRDFPCDWVVTKDLGQTEYNELGPYLITSRHLWGMPGEGEFGFFGQEPFYVFDHVACDPENPDYSVIGQPDKIFVGKSSLTSGMHVAAHMGAANIILCGIDGGTLDGQLQYEQYSARARGDDVPKYREFVAGIMSQTRAVRDRLLEVYGCRTYSLNPFLGFNLEGHAYECLDSSQGHQPSHPAEKPATAGANAVAGMGDLEGPTLDS